MGCLRSFPSSKLSVCSFLTLPDVKCDTALLQEIEGRAGICGNVSLWAKVSTKMTQKHRCGAAQALQAVS